MASRRLKEKLTPLQFQTTQECINEKPFTGRYHKFYEDGLYKCVVCEETLFQSEEKYDAGTGWPSFKNAIDLEKIKVSPQANEDFLLVACSKCNCHLGHLYNDGPVPTRKRYCINSASLQFTPRE